MVAEHEILAPFLQQKETCKHVLVVESCVGGAAEYFPRTLEINSVLSAVKKDLVGFLADGQGFVSQTNGCFPPRQERGGNSQ